MASLRLPSSTSSPVIGPETSTTSARAAKTALFARWPMLREPTGGRDVTILATGSEVEIALAGADTLAAKGIKAAVVSMPCWELFEAQPASYRAEVLGKAPRVGVEAAVRLGAPVVELHTGRYCELEGEAQTAELRRIADAAALAAKNGIEVHAGHGLTFDNVVPVAAIPQLAELNIGHFLIGEAIFDGLAPVVKRMRALMDAAR